ncbi:dihydrolipoamide acetyltransferase [bacterium]|nr:dihydrolipoamide acetyltransferase [bacterium]
MPKEVIMPALGMAQETGTLLRWLKKEGDAVVQGEPIMEIATDKVDVEIEASATGVLAQISAAEGDDVPVGQVIALIFAPGEAAPAAPTSPSVEVASVNAAPETAAPPAGVTVTPVAARMAAEHNVDLNEIVPIGNRIEKKDVLAHIERRQQATAPGAEASAHPLASPKARRLAAERGVDLGAIQGSGPDGAVLAGDVPEAAPQSSAPVQNVKKPERPVTTRVSAAEPPPPLFQRSRPTGSDGRSRLWQVMAERLSQSWREVPHFYLSREVDASALKVWRGQLQARGLKMVTYTDLLVKLTAVALDHHPRLNASWIEDSILYSEHIHIGLAVAIEEGLLVPVIHHADQLGLVDLSSRRAELVGRALEGKSTANDLTGSTFTISNLGMYGVDNFNAIVNPPQAAILAVGRIADRVVAVNGQPAVRPMMTLTLSCDHRVVDGARGAQFLAELAALIEDPLRVLE